MQHRLQWLENILYIFAIRKPIARLAFANEVISIDFALPMQIHRILEKLTTLVK